jgi:general secretion pathway protein E
VSARFLREARALPVREDEHELALAMVDPTDDYTIGAFRLVTGREIRPLVALPTELDAAMERLYGAGKSALGQIWRRRDARRRGRLRRRRSAIEGPRFGSAGDPARVVDHHQRTRHARLHIHIEPFENRLVVRYRIDGVLHEVESPRRLSAAVISRIKIMANLDIAERRCRGRSDQASVQGKEIDLRVSTVPTMHGESMVLRILDKGGVALDFRRLGFEDDTLKMFTDVLLQPHGVLLVTGPTGSGKTTTLYTALDLLNKPDVKILTSKIRSNTRCRASTRSGQAANRSDVRQRVTLDRASGPRRDHDRRDPRSGNRADRRPVGLTGHLVLSTVHTNDAPSTVNRLLDMGVEDYLLTSTVVGILAQRLVRTLCEQCKEPYTALEMVEQFGLRRFSSAKDITLHHPKGCSLCARRVPGGSASWKCCR